MGPRHDIWPENRRKCQNDIVFYAPCGEMALNQYQRTWHASWATIGSLVLSMLLVMLPATLIDVYLERHFEKDGGVFRYLPLLLIFGAGVPVVLIIRRYWKYLDLWCSCFGCGKSNRALFVVIELNVFTIFSRQGGRSYATRPSPICQHCQHDLREMTVDDEN